MLNFFKRKRKGNGIVALDMGAEIVKAALFTVEEKQNQNGEVIGKRAILKALSEVAQEDSENRGGMITDIGSVIENCKSAIRLAGKQAGFEPSQLVIGVAGESVKGATSVLSYEREDPKAKINLSELHNIIHKLQWRAFGEIRKKISEEWGYPEIDIKLMSSAIVDIKIDSYKVTNPLGFQGKTVEMALFNAFAPLAFSSALQNIADQLGLELLGIVSEAYALSRCIASAEDSHVSALLIDMGGSTTDLAVVSQGTLRGTKMFAIGGRTFTKRLAVELNIAFREAEKLKIAYTADQLEPKSKKIIGDIIQTDVETWLEGIVLALSEFSDLNELPSRILLSGGGSHLPEIKEALNNRKWYKKLHFSQIPQAVFMRPTDLPNLIDETKKIKDQKNIIPAALVSMGLELAGEETLVSKTLRKVIGIMKV